MSLDARLEEAALAYRLGLVVTLSRREAVRLAAAVAALPGGAAGAPAGAGAPPAPADVAARLAAVLGPRLPEARGGERWLPWQELQTGGPPAAWDIALAVARLPARRRALVALCAVGELPPHAVAGALGLDSGRAAAELAAALRAVAGAVPDLGGRTPAAVAQALRHVLAHEPVPPAVTAAAGRAEPGPAGDGGGTPGPSVAAAARPRRPTWRGMAVAVLVTGALGLAVAPDAARWLGGPLPGEPAVLAGDGGPELGGTPVAGGDTLDRAYRITRTREGLVAIGDPLPECDPAAPLHRQEGFVFPERMVRNLATVAAEDWQRVQGQMGLLAVTGGPAGWEIVGESRTWLTRLDLQDCRPMIRVDVGRGVRQEVMFRYGDHVVTLNEIALAELPGPLPDGQPVHVAGWPAQLLRFDRGGIPPLVVIRLPDQGRYRHLVEFLGWAGRAPLPPDELLAHLEDFVPILLGPPPAAAATPHAVACSETPAQDRWPEDYGRARGQRDIWLIDNGVGHGSGALGTVGWRVIGAVDRLIVRAKRLDGPETFEMVVTDRVAPNGRDHDPKYWDAVSYLTFPSAGCWELNLQAGEKSERITLTVR